MRINPLSIKKTTENGVITMDFFSTFAIESLFYV